MAVMLAGLALIRKPTATEAQKRTMLPDTRGCSEEWRQ